VSPASPELAGLEIVMEVRAYRERPTAQHAGKGTAQALWTFLAAQAASSGATAP
jgi:hypothetical protein